MECDVSRGGYILPSTQHWLDNLLTGQSLNEQLDMEAKCPSTPIVFVHLQRNPANVSWLCIYKSRYICIQDMFDELHKIAYNSQS